MNILLDSLSLIVVFMSKNAVKQRKRRAVQKAAKARREELEKQSVEEVLAEAKNLIKLDFPTVPKQRTDLSSNNKKQKKSEVETWQFGRLRSDDGFATWTVVSDGTVKTKK